MTAGGKPVVLSIAGSDNSAGAGAQADLKAISAQGCYGLTAITCVVAEVPGKVSAIQKIDTAIVAEQIRLSFEAFPIAAVKTGMLCSTSIVETVAATLAECFTKTMPFLVVDPVMVATSGAPLLEKAAISAYEELLFPMAGLLTPNLDELRALTGKPCRDTAEMKEAGLGLADRFGTAILLKGGHLGGDTATDILLSQGSFHEFSAPFVRGVSTHGTGCTFSSAIAANVARGMSLPDAVSAAKKYLTAAVAGALKWGATHALDHFPFAEE